MGNENRTNAPGSPDETWGPLNNGQLHIKDVVTAHIFPDLAVSGILILPDENTLVSSSVVLTNGPYFSIAKLDSFGHVDKSFGSEGFLTELFAPDLPAWGGSFALKDERIYMFGISKSPISLDGQIAILCIDKTGKRNKDFGTNGQIIIKNIVDDRVFHSNHHFIRTLEDGSLLIGTAGATGPSRNRTGYLMKFDASGKPVTSFGSNGIVDIQLPDAATLDLTDVCILENGNILVSGYARPKTSEFSIGLLVMLNSTGSFNPLFGSDPAIPGFRLFTEEGHGVELRAVTARRPGKFLAAGSIGNFPGRKAIGLLVGFDHLGKNDIEFNDGNALEGAVSPTHTGGWDAVVTQKDDIYVAGGGDLTLALFKLDGKLNTAFGTEGVVEGFVSGSAAALLPYSSDRLLCSFNATGLGGDAGILFRHYRV
ncbi:hypothetical protein [Pseudomonas siliginis]|jgi:hypothetical protein|uniref:Delta-60 repeat domain-containing protein n=1 Tax=Pseudomonas siliginis TaxID=2842346 RepID=A0ABY5CH51_9PSED|nr:hypothetical protein [Pseudomonas siliginis]UST85991.1 hypothetical protein NF677_04750 [Pseudomonas siliginis]